MSANQIVRIKKGKCKSFMQTPTCFLRKLSYCSPDAECCMFLSYSTTMYCPTMRFDSTVTAMMKLRIVYNNGLRRLLNVPKYNSASEMFVNLNIPSFNELLCKFVFSSKNQIMNSDNLLVYGIVRSATPLFSKIWALWSDIHNT